MAALDVRRYVDAFPNVPQDPHQGLSAGLPMGSAAGRGHPAPAGRTRIGKSLASRGGPVPSATGRNRPSPFAPQTTAPPSRTIEPSRRPPTDRKRRRQGRQAPAFGRPMSRAGGGAVVSAASLWHAVMGAGLATGASSASTHCVPPYRRASVGPKPSEFPGARTPMHPSGCMTGSPAPSLTSG